MKNKKYLILFLLFFYTAPNYSADTVSIRYFPLNVGNIYVYMHMSAVGTYYSRARITRDTLMHERKYFFCTGFPNTAYGWCRTDTNTGSLYRYDTSQYCKRLEPYDVLVDSLAMRNGGYMCYNSSINCLGEGNINLFGIPTQQLGFYEFVGAFAYYHAYAKDFGFLSGSINGGGVELVGCVIKGVLFGDTTIPPIGIVGEAEFTPEKYFLFQNYPNPFNPSTTIKYAIPEAGERHAFHVQLKIYDIHGREVTTLVNESKEAGYYEVKFNGSDFASGVYFYRLEAVEFTLSKKMVLIK